MLQSLSAAGQFGDDGVHRGGPDERLWGFVPGSEEVVDGGLQVWHAAEGTTTDSLVRQFSKPAFHQIQSRAARGDEVHVEARMPLEPGLDLGVFVRGVVVRDQVQLEFGGSLLVDQREELDPLLMAMLRLAGADDLTGCDIDRGEQVVVPLRL